LSQPELAALANASGPQNAWSFARITSTTSERMSLRHLQERQQVVKPVAKTGKQRRRRALGRRHGLSAITRLRRRWLEYLMEVGEFAVNVRTTLRLYTRSVSEDRMAAQGMFLEAMLKGSQPSVADGL
jgi:hypothetical protein